MFEIREFNYSKEHYAALEAVERAVWPDGFETADEIEFEDRGRREKFFGRYLAIIDDQPVASAAYIEQYWVTTENQYHVYLAVVPQWERNGIGSALWEQMMTTLAPRNPVALQTWTREDRPQSVRFLEKRGFECKLREPISQLAVDEFDAEPWQWAWDKIDQHGIKLYDLHQLAELDSDWKQKVWEMRWPIRQDVPSPDEKKRVPFEEWVRDFIDNPQMDHAGYIVAVGTKGEFVGHSYIWTSEGDPEKLYTGTTGVLREWRRKGIATALKLRVIDYAKRNGVKIIETDNSEDNPMLTLNIKLGFVQKPGYLIYQKVV